MARVPARVSAGGPLFFRRGLGGKQAGQTVGTTEGSVRALAAVKAVGLGRGEGVAASLLVPCPRVRWASSRGEGRMWVAWRDDMSLRPPMVGAGRGRGRGQGEDRGHRGRQPCLSLGEGDVVGLRRMMGVVAGCEEANYRWWWGAREGAAAKGTRGGRQSRRKMAGGGDCGG